MTDTKPTADEMIDWLERCHVRADTPLCTCNHNFRTNGLIWSPGFKPLSNIRDTITGVMTDKQATADEMLDWLGKWTPEIDAFEDFVLVTVQGLGQGRGDTIQDAIVDIMRKEADRAD